VGWAARAGAGLRTPPRPLAARALRAAAASAGLALGAAQLAQALDEAAQPGTVIALRGGALRVLARAIRIESARRPTPAADRGLQSAAAVAAAVDGE
jgi:hypothetical protein